MLNNYRLTLIHYKKMHLELILLCWFEQLNKININRHIFVDFVQVKTWVLVHSAFSCSNHKHFSFSHLQAHVGWISGLFLSLWLASDTYWQWQCWIQIETRRTVELTVVLEGEYCSCEPRLLVHPHELVHH